jgi:HD-GYP domain-containing protein (c-di-GMP phosphodiesterase class II)
VELDIVQSYEIAKRKLMLAIQLAYAKKPFIFSNQGFPSDDDFVSLVEQITRTCIEQFRASQAWVGLCIGENINWVSGWPSATEGIPFDDQFVFSVMQSQTYAKSDERGLRAGKSGALFPLLVENEVVALIGILGDGDTYFSDERISLLNIFCQWAATSLEYARRDLATRIRLGQLEILGEIDEILLSSPDLQEVLSAILEKIIQRVGVNAADVFLFNSDTQSLEFLVELGFKAISPKRTRLHIREKYAERVVVERRKIIIRDINQVISLSQQTTNYVGIPLIVRSEVKGVLEIFCDGNLLDDPDVLELFEMIANRIAVTVDNAMLLKSLDDRNAEVIAAYNATIEGLSCALELRDRETEGHTRRVAEMTVRLAEKMGIPLSERIHIQQGALLHDIGKMGIPDAILLKPGSLTQQEWAIMKHHPVYAHNILSRIEYLRPALDIPLYHHEHWDGSGYPYGLRGEHIPLAARIFAVVDVYDALISDRPYRSAWSKSQTLVYIRDLAGKYFDPGVVKYSMELISDTVPR